jgi:hypothetical protein
MLQYLFDDLIVFDEGDDPHFAMAFRAYQGIDLVNSLGSAPSVVINEYLTSL